MSASPVATLPLPNGARLEVVIADLLRETTDAIVNAANGHLAHGGGVAAAIARAAGPELDRESEALVQAGGAIPTGEAVVTTAGRLRFQGVVHAVGPRLGEGDEGRKLQQALVAAFLRAHERGWRSLSFPAVSSGIFAVPPEVCARAYVSAARRFFDEHPETSLTLLRLCLFEGAVADAVRREVNG
ncbi:MAG TPA: macro domain-containing protein [Vicinamibacteria bacterium]|nr:macro domain-containing protein [Vicinamibacteria bacterium]